MSNATKLLCNGCGVPSFTFSGGLCAACKRAERMAEIAKESARIERQKRLGYVGDERRAQAVLDAFDALSLTVREQAGCPRRAG